MTNGWVSYGDISPWHGQLWIKAPESEDQDFAECVEIIGPGDFEILAENQVMIVRGSIYMPLDDPKRMKAALDCAGSDIETASWIEKAYACNAYHGIDPDTYGGKAIVQIGAKPGDVLSRRAIEPETPDITLHGNAKLENYIRDEFLN